MQKIYRMKDLECAVCAAKMQRRIQKLKGVREVQVDFLTQKMLLDAEVADWDALMQEVSAICRSIEPQCIVCL